MEFNVKQEINETTSAAKAQIFRCGQFREVRPFCRPLAHMLRTIVHIAAPHADRSLQVHARATDLYEAVEVIGKPGLAFPAGWEPVAHRLLAGEGFAVETISPARAPLSLPELGHLHRLDVVDPALFDCVQEQERALIHYAGDHVDPVILIAQVALAWPTLRIAVIVTKIAEGRHIRDRLRGYGVHAVVVNSRNQPSQVGQVAVCTPAGLSHLPVRVAWLDMVIVLNALELTSKLGMECIGYACRARLFGLLESGEQPAPLERDFMTGLFGFHEIMIPSHRHRERVVQVLRYPICGGSSLPSQLDVLTAKRQGLWHHALRNRKLARIASASREKDIDKIQQMFAPQVNSLFRSHRRGVVILVENLEHALALSCRLRDWPILTGFEVCMDGLPRQQAQKVRCVSPLGEADPLFAIVTAAGIGALELSSVGVVVRADGGVGLPALPRRSLAEPVAVAASPLLLIDLNDRHHPLLRRWNRWRQVAYAERGRFAPGVDPVQGRVERLLSRRLQGS